MASSLSGASLKAGTPRRYRGELPETRHAGRRARLMAAALDSFGTVGYFGTSIEGLCAAARVAPRSFYEHSESKEDLLLALYDELLEGVAENVLSALAEAPLEPDASARAGLKAFIDSVLDELVHLYVASTAIP